MTHTGTYRGYDYRIEFGPYPDNSHRVKIAVFINDEFRWITWSNSIENGIQRQTLGIQRVIDYMYDSKLFALVKKLLAACGLDDTTASSIIANVAMWNDRDELPVQEIAKRLDDLAALRGIDIGLK